MLTELDGLESRGGVYVIAATNRPDMIDPAMCRPGRLDKLLYVDLPDAEERIEIMRALTRRVPLRVDGEWTETGNLVMLVKGQCDGFSGADLAALVREAGAQALRRIIGGAEMDSSANVDVTSLDISVTITDFELALKRVQPSVSPLARKNYNSLRTKFGLAPIQNKMD